MVFFGFGLDQLRPKKPYNELTQQEQAERAAESLSIIMQSCPGKLVLSGVTGYALGGIFGLFISSMQYDTPIHSPLNNLNPNKTFVDLPFKQQMKLQFKDMGKRSLSSAKSFGTMGAIYSGSECLIESLRAKNDYWNGVWGGCSTGGVLAVKNGPVAAGMGCVGFAAFSAAIEWYLRSEDGKPPANDFD